MPVNVILFYGSSIDTYQILVFLKIIISVQKMANELLNSMTTYIAIVFTYQKTFKTLKYIYFFCYSLYVEKLCSQKPDVQWQVE